MKGIVYIWWSFQLEDCAGLRTRYAFSGNSPTSLFDFDGNACRSAERPREMEEGVYVCSRPVRGPIIFGQQTFLPYSHFFIAIDCSGTCHTYSLRAPEAGDNGLGIHLIDWPDPIEDPYLDTSHCERIGDCCSELADCIPAAHDAWRPTRYNNYPDEGAIDNSNTYASCILNRCGFHSGQPFDVHGFAPGWWNTADCVGHIAM